MLHISLAGEVITHIGDFIITNSLLSTWVVMAILFVVAFAVSSRISSIPSRFQAFIELIIEGLYSFYEAILGKNVRKFFPVLATLFLFIIVSNWFGLVPGVGHALGIRHGGSITPLFRAPTADLNTTLALALVAFVVIQVAGFHALGGEYAKKFINTSGFIPGFVGILEMISEIGKIVSFAFRLFGNIFAGEVLLLVVASIVPVWAFFAPVPFIGLEIFVGLIQALVFSMLTAVFLSVAMIGHEH